MSPRFLAAAVAALFALAPVPARATHVWRAERLPLSGDHFAGAGASRPTMSVSVDIDANVMRVDYETGEATPVPHVVRIVGPAHGSAGNGVRVERELGGRGHLDWKFPEDDQPEILGGRMLLDVESSNGEPLLRGRIERLIDSPGGASTTLLTVMALGFAVLAVAVVATQRRTDSAG